MTMQQPRFSGPHPLGRELQAVLHDRRLDAAGAVLLACVFRRAVPALLTLATLIAVSRVYVGVHYPLDVIGGAVLGVLVATALRLLARALRRSEQKQRAG